MDTFVITLDRTKERWLEFTERNAGLIGNVQPFRGVDGTTVERALAARGGIITADLAYSDGALGNFLSHLELWELALARGQPITVCEDDAIFNRNFFRIRDAMAFPPGWHFITWAWNFDSILTFELIPGVSRCLGAFQQEHARRNVGSFRDAEIRPSLFRVRAFFGVVAYSISPAGILRLKEMCLPVRNTYVPIVGLGQSIPNADWSVLLNMHLPRLDAYVSFPPLVFTPNDRARSTVLR